MSPDLISFLRARLNEDAKIARSVTDQQTVESLDAVLSIAQPDATPASVRAIAVHVARWDPARVLAEVAAKRRIIELHSSTETLDTPKCTQCDWQRWPCPTLRIMTQAYVGHLDYNPAWNVTT